MSGTLGPVEAGEGRGHQGRHDRAHEALRHTVVATGAIAVMAQAKAVERHKLQSDSLFKKFIRLYAHNCY